MQFSGTGFVLMVLLAGLILVLGCAAQGQQAATDVVDNGGGQLAKDGSAMGNSGNGVMDEPNDGIMEKEGDSVMADGDAIEEDGAVQEGGVAQSGGQMMEKDSFYVPFTKEGYEKAKAEGKVIFLEFYANWCPYCAKQKPVNESTFSGPNAPENVAGFQVNYKDSETDASEEALAREFNITYQHTRVILKSDGSVSAKATGEQGREQIIEALLQAGA